MIGATLTVHCVGDSPLPPLVVGALLIVLAMLSWRKGARTQSTIDRPSLYAQKLVLSTARDKNNQHETHTFSHRHWVRFERFLRVCAGRKNRVGRVCRWLLQHWLSIIQGSESNHWRTGRHFQTRQRSEQRYFRGER